ncbi:hypothetical protein CYMTET_34667 [Cymbomonas tetramitiformis]|uniref:EGF-like domain-containing protein n=1 Tax=Cymbomonas tetramitiformis TaxID=36881 RepID=A0AAE0FAT7_9CHLO|nr:hypothetical protein CYMTET_34667 [Cymbomonas tetramitiformis]
MSCYSEVYRLPTCECASQCLSHGFGAYIRGIQHCLMDSNHPHARAAKPPNSVMRHTPDGLRRGPVLIKNPDDFYRKADTGMIFGPFEDIVVGDQRRRIVELGMCEDQCSHRGSCGSRDSEATLADCFCYQGFHGKTCEHSEYSFCLNQCSGRGNCINGFCHCEAGWWGIDCAQTSPQRALPVPGGEEVRPRIYIYDLPRNFTSQMLKHHRNDQAYAVHRIYASPGHTSSSVFSALKRGISSCSLPLAPTDRSRFPCMSSTNIGDCDRQLVPASEAVVTAGCT